MPRSGARTGCLTLLVLFALFGVALQLFGTWSGDGPDQNGGGRFALMGLFGVVLFVTVFGVAAVVGWFQARRHRQPHGFPVITRHNSEA